MPITLGLKPGHDGALALVIDGDLVYSLEAEKDSFERYSPLTAQAVVDALTSTPDVPEVVALGGWHKSVPGLSTGIGAGYRGVEPGELRKHRLFGRLGYIYSSSHERSHIFCGVAMSPFDPVAELAILLWEGVLGGFYRWRGPHMAIDSSPVLDQPGARYAALYALADPQFPDHGASVHGDYAGKLMALAGHADQTSPSHESVQVVNALLRLPSIYPFAKVDFRRSRLYNCGFIEAEFCRAAKLLSDRIFEIYHRAALSTFEAGLPLVVVGGCGLNCDWNSMWRTCGHFDEVFVPPVANDTGSAIGTAVDAEVQLGGSCKLRWDAYCGHAFLDDVDPTQHGWRKRPLDLTQLSDAMDGDHVVAWVQGRCEIGPRALGHRSLLASASDRTSRRRLNEIRGREDYRPIAPICLEEDLGKWFDEDYPDPHMLYFRTVQTQSRDRIPAVTHVDGSARVQSVTEPTNRRLHELLLTHRARTGIGVFCNTSLNFKGAGFINRTVELLHFCTSASIDHVVIDDRRYVRG
jgi:hydroxymethyl cephem carbamoyltransferase